MCYAEDVCACICVYVCLHVYICACVSVFLLRQLQSHDAFRLSLHTFTPELQLGVDGPVKYKVLLQALSMESTHWRMVTHLF